MICITIVRVVDVLCGVLWDGLREFGCLCYFLDVFFDSMRQVCYQVRRRMFLGTAFGVQWWDGGWAAGDCGGCGVGGFWCMRRGLAVGFGGEGFAECGDFGGVGGGGTVGGEGMAGYAGGCGGLIAGMALSGISPDP